MYRWNPEDYARHSAGQETWARELLSGLDLRPDDRVLDIGCGDGRITAELAKRVPFGGAVGVDLSEDMIRYAAKRFPAPDYPNLEFRQADARALPFYEELMLRSLQPREFAEGLLYSFDVELGTKREMVQLMSHLQTFQLEHGADGQEYMVLLGAEGPGR